MKFTRLLLICFLMFNLFKVQAQHKNIIIIFTDDQGYEDLSCFGSKNVETPNIDKMAEEGMKLTSFYTASSVCSPSRAALLTGRMPKRVGVPKVLFSTPAIFNGHGLPTEEITIAELLKKKNYATALVGKWHLGHEKDYLPLNQGFDSYYGIPYSNDMSIAPNMEIAENVVLNEGYTLERLHSDASRVAKHYKELRNKPPLMRGNEVIEYPADQSTLTKRYTNEAVSFIEENKENPFFLYLAHTFPHKPIFTSDEFKGVSNGGPYYDAITEIDWSVCEVMKALKTNNLEKNTIVIYTSDNGPNNLGSAKPLKGKKFSTYEGGQRVPAIVWAPSEVKAGSNSNELVSTLDLFPTIAKFTGIDLPKNKIYDGYDVSKFLCGKSKKPPRKEMFYYSANTTVIDGMRLGDWKFLYKGHKVKNFGKLKGDDLGDKLYNIKDDVSESNNLIEKFPEKAKALIHAMKTYDSKFK